MLLVSVLTKNYNNQVTFSTTELDGSQKPSCLLPGVPLLLQAPGMPRRGFVVALPQLAAPGAPPAFGVTPLPPNPLGAGEAGARAGPCLRCGLCRRLGQEVLRSPPRLRPLGFPSEDQAWAHVLTLAWSPRMAAL